MLVSLAGMLAIQLLPKLSWSRGIWEKFVGTEVFWPWYTLVGTVLTLGSAWVFSKLAPRPNIVPDLSGLPR
jgi:hypothetical protein